MADATQQTQQQTSPGDSQAAQSAAQTQASAAASSVSATTNSTPAPQRPAGLADEFWDEKAGVKTDALIKSVGELSKVKSDLDARAAALPATAEAYAIELPKDFKLPEGWSVNAEDPLWKSGREFAKAAGLTQDQFSSLAKVYVEGRIAEKQAEGTAIAEATAARDKALGANGAARVEALKVWFNGAFGEPVGKQLATTLFTPDIVSAFEKLQTATVSQGLTGFTQTGRTGGRADGKPENWDTMSPVDRRTYTLMQQDEARKRA